jgi:hypothetical protein
LLRRLPLLRLPLGHPVRDVRGDQQQAFDRLVSGPLGGHGEVGVDLPDPAGTEIELRPPLGPHLRLAGRVHPVEQLVQLLPDDFGERLPAGHADHAGPAGERPVRRVRRHDAVIRARQGHHHHRHLFKGISHGACVAHQLTQAVVRATQPVVIVSSTRQDATSCFFG